MEADCTVTEQHKRREGYWLYYEQARKSEQDFMRKIVVGDTKKPTSCKEKKTNRGCKPVHSRDKMDFLCLLKVAKNIPFRDVINDLGHVHNEQVDESEPD